MNEEKKTSNVPLFIGLAAVVAIALGVVVAQRMLAPSAAPAGTSKPDTNPVSKGPALVSDEERAAYIQSFIVISNLTVDPDTQIGPEGTTVTIPGQLKVQGVVKNNGDKAIERLILAINPLGAEGTVIGSYREDVSLNRRLNPSEERAFAFRIPDKKEFSGEYQHRVE